MSVDTQVLVLVAIMLICIFVVGLALGFLYGEKYTKRKLERSIDRLNLEADFWKERYSPDLEHELRAARCVVEAARIITAHRLFQNCSYEGHPTPGNIWPVIRAMREGVAFYDQVVSAGPDVCI